MNKTKIRYCSIKDASLLSKLTAKTFWDAYHTDSKLEQTYIKSYMKSAFSLEQIKSELIEEDTIYLLFENMTSIVGYSKMRIGNTRPEITQSLPIEISRIYLKKEFWGKGYGIILLNECFKAAIRNGCELVWLSVWQHNKKAIGFYKEHGFETVGSHVFDLAGSDQMDLLMEKPI